jgi:hypothetical protein
MNAASPRLDNSSRTCVKAAVRCCGVVAGGETALAGAAVALTEAAAVVAQGGRARLQ